MNWQLIIGVFFIIGGIGNLTEDISVFLFGIALGLALMYWGLRKKGKVKKIKAALPKERVVSEETFYAVGVSYYENNIHKLACNNPDWKLTSAQIIQNGKVGKRIYKNNYVNKPVKLQEEPLNPHDKNAIAVIVAGELVGYISQSDNLHIKEILHKRKLISLSSFIGGGEYKTVDEDGTVVKNNFGFSVSVRIKYI